MWSKPALQSCGLSDPNVDGNPDKWKYISSNLQSKIRRGKEFFGREHMHPTVNIAFQPGI